MNSNNFCFNSISKIRINKYVLIIIYNVLYQINWATLINIISLSKRLNQTWLMNNRIFDWIILLPRLFAPRMPKRTTLYMPTGSFRRQLTLWDMCLPQTMLLCCPISSELVIYERLLYLVYVQFTLTLLQFLM